MMKRAFKVTIGILVALCGISLVAAGIYLTFQSTWEWLALAAFGGGVTIAGYSLATGAKAKEFFEMLRDTFGV